MTVVDHFDDAHQVVARTSHDNMPAFGRVADGIANQIVKNSGKSFIVASNHDNGFGLFQLEYQRTLFRLDSKGVDSLLSNPAQVDVSNLECGNSGFDTRQPNQIQYQVAQSIGLLLDALHKPKPVYRVIQSSQSQRFGIGFD